jgi:FKBP-type peptidyl-prolyl cis-trans isomerase
VRTPGAHTGCRYGDRDRSSLIKAGSTLLFELELVALA